MTSNVPLMADVEGMDEREAGDIKNDFAYHNNVAGAAKHIRSLTFKTSNKAETGLKISGFWA